MTGQSLHPADPTRITADRLCRVCGGNLIGCDLSREEHYHLLIARCPQCSAVNSVQTYPHLTEWEVRWRRLIAGFWFLIAVCLFLFGGFGLFAWSAAVAFEAFDQTGWMLYDEFEFRTEQSGAETAGVITFDVWWGERSIREFVAAEMGGWMRVLDDDALSLAAIGVMFATVYGIILSIAMVHRRTRSRLVLCAIQYGVSFAAGVLILLLIVKAEGVTSEAAVIRGLIIPAALVCGAVYGGAMLLSVWLGRALLRWLAVVLLPPRLRGPLAFLWTCDGRSLPRGAPL